MSVRLSELPIPSLSLDQALAKRAELDPHKLVLSDDADRDQWIEGSAKVFTFSSLDKEVTRYAKAFSAFQLPLGSVVAVHMGLVSEQIITILALMRAGLKPFIIPLSWRKAEMIEALWNTQVRVLITHSHFLGHPLAQDARLVAQEIFSVRFVAAFGDHIPDGVLPLSDAAFVDDLAQSGNLSLKRKRHAEEIAVLFPEANEEGFATIGWNSFGICSASVLASVSLRLQPHHSLCTTLQLNSAASFILAIGAMCFTGNALHLCFVQDVEHTFEKMVAGQFDRILVPVHLLDEKLAWNELPLAVITRNAEIPFDFSNYQNTIYVQAIGERAFLPATATREGFKCFKQAITTSPEILFCDVVEDVLHIGGLAHGYLVSLQSGVWVGQSSSNMMPIHDVVNYFEDSPDRIGLAPLEELYVAGGVVFPNNFVEGILLALSGVRQVQVQQIDDLLLGHRLSYNILLEPEYRMNKLDIISYLRERGVSPLLRPAQVHFETIPQDIHLEVVTSSPQISDDILIEMGKIKASTAAE